jgi:hypothetical protein
VYQQIKMIVHQDIGHQVDIINFAAAGQHVHEDFAILIGQKDILPVIAPVHQVVITVGQLDS